MIGAAAVVDSRVVDSLCCRVVVLGSIQVDSAIEDSRRILFGDVALCAAVGKVEVADDFPLECRHLRTAVGVYT